MKIAEIRKAIIAILGGIVTLAGPHIPGLAEIMSPEALQSIAVLITTGLVYAVPNEAPA